MFLSLSTGAWLLIAAGAVLINLVAMRWIIQVPEYRGRQVWMPVIGIVCVGGGAVTHSSTVSETLFLFSALLLAFPVMLAPVRNQITRDYYRWVEDPTTKPGKATLAWLVTSLLLILVVVAVLLAVGGNTDA